MSLTADQRLEVERMVRDILDQYSRAPADAPGLRRVGDGELKAASGSGTGQSVVIAGRSMSPPVLAPVPTAADMATIGAVRAFDRTVQPVVDPPESLENIGAVMSFGPRPPDTRPVVAEDAQIILAVRSFGA